MFAKKTLYIKFYCLLFLMLGVFIASFSQGLSNIWLLGYAHGTDQFTTSLGAIVDYNTGVFSLTPVTNKMKFLGTQGNISNEQGNLLMSSNGIWIADATGDTMMNGNNLNPGSFATSWNYYGSTLSHGNFFLPWPGDSSKFVLFHMIGNDTTPSYINPRELFYTIIDMTLNGGLGGVIQKNIVAFSDTLSAGITACRHANGRDWWIVCIKDDSNKLITALLTPSGIASIQYQSFSTNISDWGNACEPVFSPDGNRFAFTTGHFINLTASVSKLNYFDFDRCTGIFSNYHSINITDGTMSCGTAFSSDSKVLYATTLNHIYQVNTLLNQFTADTIATYDGFLSATSPCPFGFMYLAGDNKIYITSFNYGVHLHCINSPDSLGAACNIQQHIIQLPCYHLRSVPDHPNYFLGPVAGSVCDSLTVGINENNDIIKLQCYPNPVTGNTVYVIYRLPQNTPGLLDIIDITGKIIYKQPLSQWSTFQQIQLPPLPEGVYLLSVKSGNKNNSLKFIVVH